MKYRVVKTDKGKVSVDESSYTPQGEYYVDDSGEVRQSVTSNRWYWSQRPNHFKITATINHSIDKDVPMVVVEDEVKKLMKTPLYTLEKQYGLDVAASLNVFIKGMQHKAAQQKGGYSEEDLINAAKYGYEFRDTTSFPEHKFEDSCINNFKQHIQSLNQEYIELETEENCLCTPLCKHPFQETGNCRQRNSGVLQIKTDQIFGQLRAYIKINKL